MSKLSAISIFTGSGGLDYGFEAAGFCTRVAVECDPTCVATLSRNRRWQVIDEPIETVLSEDLLYQGGVSPGEADILIGGPPCQPFSKAAYWATGQSRRLRDPRANTLEQYLRVLEDARPGAFLLENVEGLGFRGKSEGLELIKRGLNRINAKHGTNYRAAIAVLNAAEYGVPQMRRRLFVVGSRDGTEFVFPTPTHHDSSRGEGADPYLTAWDALYDIPEPNDEALRVRGKWADLLPSIPEGHNYLWHTERGGGAPLFGWRRRYWSFLLKLARNRPSWTLPAQPGPATGPFHWNDRRLSFSEMKRLQTFPSSIDLHGSYSEVQRQLGNAVPSLLAEVIAKEIKRQFFKGRRTSGQLKLAIPRATHPPSAHLIVKQVPRKYLAKSGQHSAHPGTGRGFRALQRVS